MRQLRHRLKAALWERAGRVPGGYGSGAAKWIAIERGIRNPPGGRYGWNDAGLDERVVEYPWLFERVAALAPSGRVLDAGSVMNHRRVLEHWRRAQHPPLSIVTLGYEGHADVSDGVRYEFADLRELPYRDEWFSVALSISTLEHVGLDNAIYGAAAGAVGRAPDADAEVGRALAELHRVTRRNGTLLASVPYGARADRGWFRILDRASVERMLAAPGWTDQRVRYFRALREGWRECSADDASDAGYNQPAGSPGAVRTAPAWVDGAEAVALIEMRVDRAS